MKLSVALGTYNGERFLAEQLASIRDQSRPPDELIICDDSSTDGTVLIARRFAATAPFAVIVEINSTNLGSTRNFEKAIGLCRGDLIALADQDDVWLPQKLERLEAAFADPDVGFAFSDAEVVDQQLKPLGFRLWDSLSFGRSERERFLNGRAFEALLRKHRVTGATMAFRSRYRDLLLPIPPDWVHDGWIALLISAYAGCAPIAEPLIRYRQHPAQQIGGRQRSLFARYRRAREMSRTSFEGIAQRYREAERRLRETGGVTPARLEALAAKIEHYRRRAEMRGPGTWRLPAILREYWNGRYSRYSQGWKAVAQDLFMG